MISSKPRKKQKTDINEIDIEEDINSKKRTSSLLVYSLKLNKNKKKNMKKILYLMI